MLSLETRANWYSSCAKRLVWATEDLPSLPSMAILSFRQLRTDRIRATKAEPTIGGTADTETESEPIGRETTLSGRATFRDRRGGVLATRIHGAASILDVTGNGLITPLDARSIGNQVNRASDAAALSTLLRTPAVATTSCAADVAFALTNSSTDLVPRPQLHAEAAVARSSSCSNQRNHML
jgi:hypothetical protein